MKRWTTAQLTRPLGALRTQLDKLAPRERKMLTLLGYTLLLALLWYAALAPAWQTWRSSKAAHAKLDAELAQMQTLAAEAKALQAIPAKSATQSKAWLEASVKQLGKATLTLQGGRAQINFNQATPEQLTAWLIEARTTAALRPIEAHWKRLEDGKSALWDGVVVFELGQ